jgi:hypothetical protein
LGGVYCWLDLAVWVKSHRDKISRPRRVGCE